MRRIYFWESWFSRSSFRLRRGVDYRCGQGTMAQNIRTAASERGLSVSITEREDGLTVRVFASPAAARRAGFRRGRAQV